MFRKIAVLFLAFLTVCACFSASAEGGFREIGTFSDGLAPVRDGNGLWGYIDRNGKFVIPCEYADAEEFSEGLAWVGKDGKYGCIDTSGRLVIPFEWNNLHDAFHEGMAMVQDGSRLCGFIDTTGSPAVPCEWEMAMGSWFSEGLAVVQKDGKQGYVSKTGEVVIPVQYKAAFPFSCGYALVQDDEGFFFIDPAGAAAFPDIPRAAGAVQFGADGIAFLSFSDNTGIFMDTEGRTVCALTPEERYRSNFCSGLAGIARKNGQGEWEEGYIGTNGEIVIPPGLYSSGRRFRNGLACVSSASSDEVRYGFINGFGELIFPITLDESADFTDAVIAAVQDGKTGAINADGSIVLPFEYDDVKVGDGMILCLKDGEISLFDYYGEPVE